MSTSSGFTLLEVLVAFVILSLTAITGMQIYSENLARLARLESSLNETDAAVNALHSTLTCASEGPDTLADLRRKVLTGVKADWTTKVPMLCTTTTESAHSPFTSIVIIHEPPP